MKITIPPMCVMETLVFFFVLLSLFTLRQLHAAGQPLLGTTIKSVGIAVLYGVFSCARKSFLD